MSTGMNILGNGGSAIPIIDVDNHQIGSIPRMLESIGALRPAAADGKAILGGNATRLLGL